MSEQKRSFPRGGPRRPLEERFWEKVDKCGPDECWPWIASLDSKGYGLIGTGRDKSVARAHRVAYELLVGPLHDWLVIDHLCENRLCCNPAHLEQVPESVNTLRSSAEVRKTHCPKGHPYNEENTILRRGKRECRICKRANENRRYHARKAER